MGLKHFFYVNNQTLWPTNVQATAAQVDLCYPLNVDKTYTWFLFKEKLISDKMESEY